MTDQQIEIGIFGGTGIYDSGLLEDSKEIEYNASGGSEYFISYESGTKLLAYVRLRLDDNATV
ncbi:MAG TPA: hypothetical protein QGF01_06210, partial [Candidatus Nitrosopelagicus sp.]|nr:hypothetical protein [Candidatus Nitrosopelagicus sp.]